MQITSSALYSFYTNLSRAKSIIFENHVFIDEIDPTRMSEVDSVCRGNMKKGAFLSEQFVV